MTTSTNLSLSGVVISSTLGSIVGAVILYAIGMLMDVNRLEKIVDRWGHILRLTKEDIHKADSWFERYGIWTVFFCRMIPLIRSLISIPAGMAKMNFLTFLLLTTIGTLLWNTLLVYLGAQFGEAWPMIVHYFDYYSNIVYILIVVAFIAGIVWFVRRKSSFE